MDRPHTVIDRHGWLLVVIGDFDMEPRLCRCQFPRQFRVLHDDAHQAQGAAGWHKDAPVPNREGSLPAC